MLEYCCREYSTGNVDSQEDNDKEDEHDSRSLMHGIQPSNHDDLHHVSVKSNIIEILQLGNSPPNKAATTTFVPFIM
jgi:hypothetical protein